jgi:regulatory protein
MSIETTNKIMRKSKKPKKITKKRLKNIALYYLERYESSEKNLEQLLLRRAKKSSFYHELDMEEVKGWIREVIDFAKEYSFVDDERYTKNKVRNLMARGNSVKQIIQKIMQKGVSKDLIEQEIEKISKQKDVDINLIQAIKYAKKKKLGVFSTKERTKEKNVKDFASLARAGFNYDIVKEIMSADEKQDLESYLYYD